MSVLDQGPGHDTWSEGNAWAPMKQNWMLRITTKWHDEVNHGALKKKFVLQPKMELLRTPCSPDANKKFDDRFANPGVPPF